MEGIFFVFGVLFGGVFAVITMGILLMHYSNTYKDEYKDNDKHDHSDNPD